MAEIKEIKKPLGRGLGSLLGDNINEDFKSVPVTKPLSEQPLPSTVPENQRIWDVDIEKIVPNEFQPRKTFAPEKIQELTASVKEKGILQPIIVRKLAQDKFELIAGERRWRAAQAAGLQKVPVIIKNVDDQQSLELALIENIQRHDLNAIEEAEAYKQLADEFLLSQQEIAQKVGKERATIANALRLLSLEPSVKQMLVNGEISVGHAKVLLALNDEHQQKMLAKKINSEKLTVRAAEKLIQSLQKKKSLDLGTLDVKKQLIKDLQENLSKTLSTKVEINYFNGKGQIGIKFYSDEELTRLVDTIKKV